MRGFSTLDMGVSPMTEYRVYCLGKDGHIVRGDYLQADDDAAALAIVRGRAEPTICELWSGSRQIAVIPPAGDRVAAI
jgi:hypothetical protein